MITQEKIVNARRNGGSVHCGTCWRMVKREEGGTEPMTQEAIDLLLSTATHHEQHHPKHSLTVTIYERTPSNEELRAG